MKKLYSQVKTNLGNIFFIYSPIGLFLMYLKLGILCCINILTKSQVELEAEMKQFYYEKH